MRKRGEDMKTIFKNGRIHTMNGGEIVDSISVEDGRIVSDDYVPEDGRIREVDLDVYKRQHFACSAGLASDALKLFLRTVNPYDFFWIRKVGTFFHPVQYTVVLNLDHFSSSPSIVKILSLYFTNSCIEIYFYFNTRHYGWQVNLRQNLDSKGGGRRWFRQVKCS